MNTSQHLQWKEGDSSLVVWFVCFESLTSSFLAHCNTTGGPTMRLSRLYRYSYWGQSNSARTNTVSKSVFSASPNSSTLSVAMHGVLMSYRGHTVKEGGGGMQRSLSYRTSPFMTPQISNMLVKMEEYLIHFCGFSIKINTKHLEQAAVCRWRLEINCCSWYYMVALGHFYSFICFVLVFFLPVLLYKDLGTTGEKNQFNVVVFSLPDGGQANAKG